MIDTFEPRLRSEEDILSAWKGHPDQPLVSICCITYNHAPYVEQTLKGFLIQETDFPFEILIHDDASTDETQAIIRRYEAAYPRLFRPIYQTRNQYSTGVRINPNFNFNRARGEYIAVCEGDDYWVDASKLQKQVDWLAQHADYVITYTDCQPFDENGLLDRDFGGARRDLSASELQRATPIHTLTACFRNVFRNIPWPKELDPSPYGDLATWCVLGDYGKGKFLSDIKPSMYRVHDGGLHSKTSPEQRAFMFYRARAAMFTYSMIKGNREVAGWHAYSMLSYLVKYHYRWMLRWLLRQLKSRILRRIA